MQNEIHLIDFFAISGANIDEIAKIIKEKPYKYGKHQLPHDAKAKTLAAQGKSVIEQLAEHLGINNMAIVPDLGVQDGIQAVRQCLPMCWFDKTKCSDGLEALRQYQREYDEDKKAFRASPRHDWTSHPSDAFRMMAVVWRLEPKVKPPDVVKPLMVGSENTVTLNDMWATHKTLRSSRL